MLKQLSVSPETRAHEPARASIAPARASVRGKFLYRGAEKFYVRGVTYGTFRPGRDEHGYPPRATVERDFAQMAEAGINALRTYTVPPAWLLDAAQEHGLAVMVGLPWEQHIAFLDDSARRASIAERVRMGVRACAGHPAVLCYAVGNEIPASIVRWYGPRRVERHIRRLYDAAKAEDPTALVTYVNFPSTEYLHLPFLDFVSFNVYLETPATAQAYLARLQNIAGDRPLVMAEIGLDSRRNGTVAQAEVIAWQIRSAFEQGCAGAFLFSWTDEWHRGGHDIEDWDFGLVDRLRRPKPALAAARRAFAGVPFPRDRSWPRVSVVVCSHNGQRTLDECLRGLSALEYPRFEVIVVDDGSTDATPAIAVRHGVRLIRTPNRGLSSARNTGLEAATGEIVAYIDDDACPDPHWLHYIAAALVRSSHAGVGGPNIPPPGDGLVAECVANAPGGPTHVLLSDEEAEHIPGCNCAFWVDRLRSIGGFDPEFRVAGDDVDVCWRLQERGWTLGFSPAAMVWHHRRNTVRGYLRQQRGYGSAEALLERKWPERYNAVGHVTWSGRLYGEGHTHRAVAGRGRIYFGLWGSAPFQSVYQTGVSTLQSLPLMPEWHVVTVLLVALAAIGISWPPLLWVAIPLLLVAVAVPMSYVARVVAGLPAAGAPRPVAERIGLRGRTALLHLLQPPARLAGRVRSGLTPWRRALSERFVTPRVQRLERWSERWGAPDAWLLGIERRLRAERVVVRRGGSFDPWDLDVSGGLLSTTRLLMGVEEHGSGRQLLRFRLSPRFSRVGVVLVAFLAALGIWAGFAGARTACAALLLLAGGTAVAALCDWSVAMAAVRRSLPAGEELAA